MDVWVNSSDASFSNSSLNQTDNNTLNGTETYQEGGWLYSNTFVIKVTILVLLSLIIAIAILGNTLVCMVVLITKDLRKTPSSYFIFSLALSDLLTSTVVMPFDLDQWVRDYRWIHGQTVCSLWTTAYMFVVPSSMWNMLAMTVDRYKSLSDPLNRYRATPFMTSKRLAAAIASVWIYSLVFSLIPQMGWTYSQYVYQEGICAFNVAPAYSVLSSGLNFLLPSVIMSGLYVKIYHIARTFNATNRVSLRNNQGNCDGVKGNKIDKAEVQKTFRKNTKAAKMVCAIVCAFLLCWMPHTLLSILGIFYRSLVSKVPAELNHCLLLLGYLNSALNPFLYSFNNRSFRKSYKRVLNVALKWDLRKRCLTFKGERLGHISNRLQIQASNQPINVSMISFASTNTIL